LRFKLSRGPKLNMPRYIVRVTVFT